MPKALCVLILVCLVSPPPATAWDCSTLSTGLYWYDTATASAKSDGQANSYFDPASPTIIFVHGWQPFLSQNQPDFLFGSTDTIAGWRAAGWNVGVFVWNQFADETTGALAASWFGDGGPPQGVLDAEAKIWTAEGPQNMRWRDCSELVLLGADGYKDAPAGTKSAGEQFFDVYVEAMTSEGDYTGGEIIIAGHSLGNQMAVRLADQVLSAVAGGTVASALQPTRIALLDPYWSPDPRDWLGSQRTGEAVHEAVDRLLADGALVEWYWSSNWTTPPQGDDNAAMRTGLLYAEMDPAYAVSDLDRHMAPRHLYFWSKSYSLACTGVEDDCRLLGQMPSDRLAAFMDQRGRWTQNAGTATFTPADDTYAFRAFGKSIVGSHKLLLLPQE